MIQLKDQKLGENVRKSFSRTRFNLELPDLVEIQTRSYAWFLREGLTEVLHEVSPIADFSGNLLVEFISYTLSDKPNYPVEECKERDVNYAAPLKVNVRLTNKQTGEVKQTDIFMGEFPLMTETGTFVINGAERVIVSQIVRSPGMYYASDIDKSGKPIFSAQVIPYRGAWLEYETDVNGVMYVRVDKTRKVPITMFIRALGPETREEVYELLGEDDRLKVTFEKDECENLAAENHTTAHVEALKEIYKRLRPGEPPLVESAEMLINNYFFDPKRYDIAPVGRYKFDKKMAISGRITGQVAADDVISPLTGELLCTAGTPINSELALAIEHGGVNSMNVRLENGNVVRVLSNNTLEPEYIIGCDLHDCGVREKVRTAILQEIVEACGGDLDEVKRQVRLRIAELCPKHITKDDIFASISYMLDLANGIGTVDDIDHLGNRRIRSVGEQLQNQFRIGFVRMEKIIKERMTTQDNDKLTPQALINIRPVVTAIREFFGSSQLSQFADQNNPLAELTHRRRLSALGPGGLSRDRASFDVRDVHYTQYGRMCPIETPEGPNIGLISYLTTYARISEYGFIEAPYRKVKRVYDENGKVTDQYVTDEVVYMTADAEDRYVVAQANEPLDETGHFINKKVTAREKTEIASIDASKVDFMDVSPKMVVSVATAMIPFLENDDNTRALMGANMQKQAVPLMVTDSPIVGTGMEFKAAVDSGVVITAKRGGRVEHVEADKIVIVTDDGSKDAYTLRKFRRTNQGTCFNQRPVVRRDQLISAGQVIADGPATSNGEVSLGKNALIGFMTWEGYNYEDAVLLSEKLVKEDIYTSIHMEEFECEARESKLGPDEITRDIPNVGEDAVKDLDERGIIRIGAEVRAGDILVGKVTPKGETELTSEERLMRAIFGEKAREVRDTSLRVPHGEWGVVVDVKIFDRAHSDELSPSVQQMVRVYIAQKRKISVGDKMSGRHGNKGVVSRVLREEDMPFLPDGTPLQIVLNPLGVPSRMNIGQVLEVHLGLACRALGWHIATPVFDGATYPEIRECLEMAADTMAKPVDESNPRMMQSYFHNGRPLRLNLDEEGRRLFLDGKIRLRDGRTGNWFENPVTVGVMYFLKLHHLVDDKMHARSVGPYSLVTQQPLGGKAQFGGQRFGEMEVWALEAYGAANTLQEILTVKSDDTVGRVKTYEAIIKGENIPAPGVPESFKVLIKELQALCLDIKVLDRDRNVIEIPELDPEDMAPPSKNNAPEQDKQESLTTLLPEDEDADAISNDFPDNDFPLNDLDSDSEDDDLSIPLSFDDDEENDDLDTMRLDDLGFDDMNLDDDDQ